MGFVCTERIVCRLGPDGTWLADSCRSATQLLQFITLVANSELSVTKCFYRKSISSFLKQVVDWLACPEIEDTDDTVSTRMLQSLLTALAILEISGDSDHITKLWKDEEIWSLAIDSECRNLFTDGKLPPPSSHRQSNSVLVSCICHICHRYYPGILCHTLACNRLGLPTRRSS